MFTRRQLVVWGMRSAYQNGCRQVNYQGGNGDTKGDMSRQWGRPDTTCVHLGEGSTLGHSGNDKGIDTESRALSESRPGPSV